MNAPPDVMLGGALFLYAVCFVVKANVGFSEEKMPIAGLHKRVFPKKSLLLSIIFAYLCCRTITHFSIYYNYNSLL